MHELNENETTQIPNEWWLVLSDKGYDSEIEHSKIGEASYSMP